MSTEKKKPDTNRPERFYPEPERLLRLKEVLQLLGISRSSFYEKIKQGVMPPGHLLGPRTRVWKYHADIKPIIDSLE